MARKPTSNGGLVDRNIPSQVDMDDLEAEVSLEIPDRINVVDADILAADVGEIEITAEDDGGVTIDFEPIDVVMAA